MSMNSLTSRRQLSRRQFLFLLATFALGIVLANPLLRLLGVRPTAFGTYGQGGYGFSSY
jgi:hypothetical protein